jgi:Tol biopolymer transport system component
VRRPLVLASISLFALSACGSAPPPKKEPIGQLPHVVTSAEPLWLPFTIRAGKSVAPDPREKHLEGMRQLTFEGENAEAYFSPDGKRLVFQSTRGGAACDQMFVMELESGEVRRLSNGQGKTTCGYFLYPAGDRVLYSSTSAAGPACPPKPDRAQGYVWPLDSFDVFVARADGSDTRPLLAGPGYDAETTVAPDGSRLVFTSTRDGDLELYTAKLDGSDVRRITNTPGYDGGAFFSPDSTKLVWRASRPTGPELDDYRALLEKHLVRPTKLEIMIADADGQNARAVTANGKANFAPSFLPDSRRVIFASNVDAGTHPGMPNFDLYVVDSEGPAGPGGMPALERVTFDEAFDGFPMFSPDGQWLVFASNRRGKKAGDTNLFIARWVE